VNIARKPAPIAAFAPYFLSPLFLSCFLEILIKIYIPENPSTPGEPFLLFTLIGANSNSTLIYHAHA
jgi:hypothetical protein